MTNERVQFSRAAPGFKHRRVGDVVPSRDLFTIHGQPVPLPDPARLVHLQFRRFTGCASCNLHLRSFVMGQPELAAAGIVEIAVFYSKAESMLKQQGHLPFAVVADPNRVLYAEFGVEKSLRSVLSLRTWLSWLKGAAVLDIFPSPPLELESKLGLPADFIIAPDGRIRDLKYGRHAYDQWSLDDVLGLAAAARPNLA